MKKVDVILGSIYGDRQLFSYLVVFLAGFSAVFVVSANYFLIIELPQVLLYLGGR